jgi:S-DNA-T family DNA segregation ATPase FtsK/SpoIIIE
VSNAFDLDSEAAKLEAALARFNIDAKVTGHSTGPVLVTYEVEPAPGTRAQRLNLVADDLARTMRAASCRVAPDFANGRVLLEMARADRKVVAWPDYMGRAVSNPDGSLMQLPVYLGQNTKGVNTFVDLTIAPHMLVAGTTGSGKSMMLNAIIMSLMYFNHPNNCRLILIDPKMLELQVYAGSPYNHCRVLTGKDEAIQALTLVIREMESRYKTLAAAGVRNIAEYRAKGLDMPYWVVVVDEIADLMQTAGKVIESHTQRIAQLARAAGIHLIIATQRPSVDVITGVIKANFPTRMALRVASKVDSRVIMDTHGAEKLLGRGDALLTLSGSSEPQRIHGPLVTDVDIRKMMERKL